jgi:signal transduction histidine kinase
LRPPSLDELGLAGAIRQQVSRFTVTGDKGLAVVVEARDEELADLPAGTEVAAFRIAVEALTNVVRHSHARFCTLRLARADGALALEIRDDGVGMVDGAGPGAGTAAMRERADELGGTCVISPRPEGGTLVEARLPLPPVGASGG